TTIRAILPFSLRLCEYFSYFQKLAYLLSFSLEISRYALVAKALHCKTAFSATEIALLFLMRVFSKLAYLLPFSLETARYALVAKAFHCKTAFSATPESEDSLVAEN
ncbi:MAG: hypothetical protein HDR53_00395, partial [Treponema sp.]|nr:hypothetical protein [Treponema sp.]